MLTPNLANQFEDIKQQHEASTLGVWIFLATEVLLFGAMFFAYTAYRWSYPGAFSKMSNETELGIATINTTLLLTSSLFMAFAVSEIQKERRNAALRSLAFTFLFGMGFMALKWLEYSRDFAKHSFSNAVGPEKIFWWLYFAMTGLHAIHLSIGISLVAWVFFRVRKDPNVNAHSVHLVGLYWHFVDGVWVFLYPLFYLIARSSR